MNRRSKYQKVKDQGLLDIRNSDVQGLASREFEFRKKCSPQDEP